MVPRHGIGDVCRTLDLSHDKPATLYRCPKLLQPSFFDTLVAEVPSVAVDSTHPTRGIPCIEWVHAHCVAEDDPRVKNGGAPKVARLMSGYHP